MSNSICLIWPHFTSEQYWPHFTFKQYLASFDASNSICLIWPHLMSNSIWPHLASFHIKLYLPHLASFDVKQYLPHLASFDCQTVSASFDASNSSLASFGTHLMSNSICLIRPHFHIKQYLPHWASFDIKQSLPHLALLYVASFKSGFIIWSSNSRL